MGPFQRLVSLPISDPALEWPGFLGGQRKGSQHEEAQRRAWLRLAPAERLAWLEGAKRFARRALDAARRRRAGTRRSG